MAIIDPNSVNVNNNQRKTVTVGSKILAPVSASFRYTMNNERYCDIHFVVIHDLEKKDEVGAVYSEKYYIRDSQNWRWALLSQCLMYEKPFDNEKLEDIQNFLLGDGNRIKVEFFEQEYNGKTNLRIRNLAKVLKDGVVPPYTDKEKQVIDKAETDYVATCNYRVEQGWKTDLLPKYNTQKQSSDPMNTDDDWDIPDEDDNNGIPF